MEKKYNPQAIEQKLYQRWEESGYFRPGKESRQGRYCIIIPPPNVTGSLHMGHAFQQTLIDALVRYQRMQGKRTLWQVGTDHAGIATQMVVERKIAAEEQKSRYDYGREAFIAKIWQWKGESGNIITKQMRRLGNSVDWERERFTLDEPFSKAVQTAFIRLYEDRLIYRGKRLVNWDPKLQTAVSDLEVENHPTAGLLWYLRYPLADGATDADGKTYVVVATTRPETILGDTAVAVHPKDPRYQQLVGKYVDLPIMQRRIPIIADDSVDPDFGSGVVKITPAHDFNDYAVGQRHQLPMINIFTPQATLRHMAELFPTDGTAGEPSTIPLPQEYQGIDRFVARRKIVEDLGELELLDHTAPHSLSVPHGDRSGVPLEPMLTDQWYVNVRPLAERAIAAVKQGEIQITPAQYENMYFSWMSNIQDWCISRQLWWGHRIPAWHTATGEIYVGYDENDVRRRYNLPDEIELQQDPDVLDTWFSSALWSFASLGWPDELQWMDEFHPTNVLITGFDILFFWVARMIMLTTYLLKDQPKELQIPFKQVYVHGLIRDENGEKMSKTKGNVVDPLDMIDGISLEDLLQKRTASMMQPQLAEKIRCRTVEQFPHGIAPHGTDALRFTLAALASTGRDIHWDMGRLSGYRNFCNKLWNASRFVLMHANQAENPLLLKAASLPAVERWLLTELNQAILVCREGFANYRFDLVANAIYEFTWSHYCDWYLEIAKLTLRSGCAAAQQTTRHILLHVLERLLCLAHPIIPFITEAIWLELKPVMQLTGRSIMLQSYPEYEAEQVDLQARSTFNWLKSLVVTVRQLRAAHGIPLKKRLPILLRQATCEQQEWTRDNYQLLLEMALLDGITFLTPEEEVPPAVGQLVDGAELFLPIAGLHDRESELARLSREIDKLKLTINSSEAKLANEAFVTRAPQGVVAQERARLVENQEAMAKLAAQYKMVATG